MTNLTHDKFGPARPGDSRQSLTRLGNTIHNKAWDCGANNFSFASLFLSPFLF